MTFEEAVKSATAESCPMSSEEQALDRLTWAVVALAIAVRENAP